MSRLDVDQVLVQHKSLDPSGMSWPWQEEDENEESEWTKTSMVRVLLTLFHRHNHRGHSCRAERDFTLHCSETTQFAFRDNKQSYKHSKDCQSRKKDIFDHVR